MPMVQVQVAGLEMTLIQLRNSKKSIRAVMGPAINAAGAAYRAEVRKRISLRDHSLKDLADRDHPYARRHGKIKIHRQKPWQVHRQSDRMVNALQARPITVGSQPGFEVTFDYGAAPHARYVIQGTRVMLPRDVLWKTATDPATQLAMMRRVVKVAGKGLKSQIGIRFGSGSPVGTSGGSTSVR